MCGHFDTCETTDATVPFDVAKGGRSQISYFITTKLTCISKNMIKKPLQNGYHNVHSFF